MRVPFLLTWTRSGSNMTSMKARRIKMFMRGVRMALDPSLAVRQSQYVEYPDTDDALARDWYAVGGDLQGALKKFSSGLGGHGRRVSSGA